MVRGSIPGRARRKRTVVGRHAPRGPLVRGHGNVSLLSKSSEGARLSGQAVKRNSFAGVSDNRCSGGAPCSTRASTCEVAYGSVTHLRLFICIVPSCERWGIPVCACPGRPARCCQCPARGDQLPDRPHRRRGRARADRRYRGRGHVRGHGGTWPRPSGRGQPQRRTCVGLSYRRFRCTRRFERSSGFGEARAATGKRHADGSANSVPNGECATVRHGSDSAASNRRTGYRAAERRPIGLQWRHFPIRRSRFHAPRPWTRPSFITPENGG